MFSFAEWAAAQVLGLGHSWVSRGGCATPNSHALMAEDAERHTYVVWDS